MVGSLRSSAERRSRTLMESNRASIGSDGSESPETKRDGLRFSTEEGLKILGKIIVP